MYTPFGFGVSAALPSRDLDGMGLVRSWVIQGDRAQSSGELLPDSYS